MRAMRRFEIALAGLIAGSASFAAFSPGASPFSGAVPPPPEAAAPPALPRVDASQFAGIRVSESSRAVAAAVVNRETRVARFSAPPPERDESGAGALAVTPRASSNAGAAWSGEALGVQLTYAPPTGPNEPNWWIIGGAGRESYAVAPGGLREFTVAPVSAETSVGDTHLGFAMELGDHAYASLGYVREVRRFSLGTEDWEEEEHYIG
ncbi:MAG: hypothetical protein ACLFQ5_11390, partial [Oceanicaulis sp.]